MWIEFSSWQGINLRSTNAQNKWRIYLRWNIRISSMVYGMDVHQNLIKKKIYGYIKSSTLNPCAWYV